MPLHEISSRSYIDDLSVSEISVLDWGSLPSFGNKNASGNVRSSDDKNDTQRRQQHTTKSPSSIRYDPSGLTRVTDITDLVLDDSSVDIDHGQDIDSDDNAAERNNNNSSLEVTTGSSSDIENGRRGEGGRDESYSSSWLCRQAIVLIALVGVIIGASLAILYAVNNTQDYNSHTQSPYLIIPSSSSGNDMDSNEKEQELIEIAERVIVACGTNKLDEDMKECQNLCRSRMCCFEESGSDYSCELDTSKDCAVYAGCEALVEGIPIGAVGEDEE